MDILFLLVPLSVLLSLAVMGLLAWAVWSGQFEELEAEGERILMTKGEAGETPASALPIFHSASLIHVNTPGAPTEHTYL